MMSGHVLRDTPIAVDFWAVNNSVELFFLSHAHTDHTKGLTSTWKSYIYTSPITAKIIQHKLKINSKVIKVLEVGEVHSIPLGYENVTVHVIDANHCPGAVMFVFQGYFGTILYTGDFRHTLDKDIALVPRRIDALYLDNTYCDPRCKFKRREDATIDIIGIITAHIAEHKILVGLRYLGKEELLVKIAKYFRKLIYVDEERFQLLKILRMNNVFTTDPKLTNIQVIPYTEVTSKNVKIWNKICPTIAILPTSLFAGMKKNIFTGQKNIFIVPYSDHSNFVELENFVRLVQPKIIYPIVKPVTSHGICHPKRRMNMTVFDRFLERSPVTIVDRKKLFALNSALPKKLPEKKRDIPLKIVPRGVVFNSQEEETPFVKNFEEISGSQTKIVTEDSRDNQTCVNKIFNLTKITAQHQLEESCEIADINHIPGTPENHSQCAAVISDSENSDTEITKFVRKRCTTYASVSANWQCQNRQFNDCVERLNKSINSSRNSQNDYDLRTSRQNTAGGILKKFKFAKKNCNKRQRRDNTNDIMHKGQCLIEVITLN